MLSRLIESVNECFWLAHVNNAYYEAQGESIL
jgi:hypothetical protein